MAKPVHASVSVPFIADSFLFVCNSLLKPTFSSQCGCVPFSTDLSVCDAYLLELNHLLQSMEVLHRTYSAPSIQALQVSTLFLIPLPFTCRAGLFLQLNIKPEKLCSKWTYSHPKLDHSKCKITCLDFVFYHFSPPILLLPSSHLPLNIENIDKSLPAMKPFPMKSLQSKKTTRPSLSFCSLGIYVWQPEKGKETSKEMAH